MRGVVRAGCGVSPGEALSFENQNVCFFGGSILGIYLKSFDLSVEEVKSAIRKLTLNNEIIPCFCGTAFKNKGVQCMLDAVVEYLPSPADVPPVVGVDSDENEVARKADDKDKFSALAFKIATDPYVGSITFFRVYSGVLTSGDTVYNPVKQKKERIGLFWVPGGVPEAFQSFWDRF